MSALQLDARNSFESAIDAQEELERVLGESDYLAAPATLEAFLERYRAATEPAVSWLGVSLSACAARSRNEKHQ